MDAGAEERLGAWLGTALGAPVKVTKAAKLTGGAIQENWLVETETTDGPRALIVRRDAPAPISASRSRADEFALISVAARAGVTVPEPVAFCHDPSVIGGPFAVMAKVEGLAFGPKVVKDFSVGGDREALTECLGRELARIHAIRPPRDELAFLGAPPARDGHPGVDIAWMRAALDAMGAPRPALEWGLRWVERRAPVAPMITLVHRDFRTGNFMLDAKGLTAVLDWEFASWGDPMADLGWICARCWRFGRDDLEAGGIGSRAALYRGYAAESDIPVDDRAVRYWEVMAHLRWAVITLQQGERHASGREFSLEHALTGRIAAELELSVLRLTAPEAQA